MKRKTQVSGGGKSLGLRGIDWGKSMLTIAIAKCVPVGMDHSENSAATLQVVMKMKSQNENECKVERRRMRPMKITCAPRPLFLDSDDIKQIK